ncbi:MAG: flavodoxin family protein [Bacteroidales bacterium]|nr:flavodoxin family protein [Bacteroidales bacterium]
MKIIIINGNPDDHNQSFDQYLADYQKELRSSGHNAEIVTLRDMNFAFCCGCFKCWDTTPGICSIDDDIKHIHRAVINADLVVWASPLIKGYFSSLLKKVQERMIPLLHPYIEIVSGEIHHRKRYQNYPDYGVFIQKENDTDSEDLRIAQMIMERYALNFRSELRFFLATDVPVPEAVRETISNTASCNDYAEKPEQAAVPALAFYTSSLN